MTSTAHVTGNSPPRETSPTAVADQGGLLVQATPVPLAMSAPSGDPAAAPGPLRLKPDESQAAIAMAARAPSLHNTQPWQFRVRGDTIELLADPDRWLRQLDPDGRELVISCGAALFGLRLGLRSLGLLPVTELLPDPAQPLLAGRVHAAGRAAMSKIEAELVAAVPHRHTHRGAFTPGDIAARLLDALVADAAAEGVELLLVDRSDRPDRSALTDELVRIVTAAAAEQQANPEVTEELRHWVRTPGSQAKDGVPAWAIARQPDKPEPRPTGYGGHDQRQSGSDHPPLPARLPQRDFGQQATDQPGSVPPSATAVLSTIGDTPTDWLRSGQALNRLLLHAATRWVFASLQSQPMESPQHRQEIRDLLGLAGHPQLLLQFGRSNTAPATPRRPQAELRTD
jgi:nitroreductase